MLSRENLWKKFQSDSENGFQPKIQCRKFVQGAFFRWNSLVKIEKIPKLKSKMVMKDAMVMKGVMILANVDVAGILLFSRSDDANVVPDEVSELEVVW